MFQLAGCTAPLAHEETPDRVGWLGGQGQACEARVSRPPGGVGPEGVAAAVSPSAQVDVTELRRLLEEEYKLTGQLQKAKKKAEAEV